MNTPVLEISGLTVEVAGSAPRQVVVDAADLQVAAAEAVGLVGESGSGKTTVLRAALRLLPHGLTQTAGQVRFDGLDLAVAQPHLLREIRGGKVGVVWQDPLAALDPLMRVGDQIAETIRAHRPLDGHAAHEATLGLMRLVELPDPARTYRAYPHQLSGGQRQRVVIAAAIGTEPRLLLADEPTTALDVTVQDQVLRLIARLRHDLRLGLLLVSHDLAVVGQTCDRVAVMYAGRIVETGPVAAVFRSPRHHYSAGLLAAAPDVGRPGVLPFAIPGSPPATGAGAGCAFAPRCPLADERCRTSTQQLQGVGEHRAACHHPLEDRGAAATAAHA